MAESGGGDTERRSPVRVWTFLVRGGPDDFSLTLPNNPSLTHNGTTTLWKLLGTKETADSALGLIRSLGATAEVFTEEESPEQRIERKRLLGLPDDSVASL
jgi:hypothetical protein